MMRGRWLWVAVIALLGAAAVILVHRYGMRRLAQHEVVTVGMQDSPPWHFLRSDGTIEGPVYDLVREAARRLGLRLVWVPDADGPEHALTSGKADIWPLMGRLPERLSRFRISDSWLDLTYLAAFPVQCGAGDGAERRPATVAHRATQVTRAIHQRHFPGVREVAVPSHLAALRAICAGQADAALISELSPDVGTLRAPDECAQRSICLKTQVVATVEFGVGSRPGSDPARAAAIALRSEIDRMIDDGSLHGIFLRWGVPGGEIRALRAARLARLRANLLAGVACGLLALLAVLAMLHRRVRAANRERDRVNAELRASQKALEEEFVRRRELEERLHQSSKMESLGRLAGGVAHDFNNLLTVINGYSELALHDLANHAAREKIAMVKRAGEKAAGLTSQLLAFSRKQIIQPKAVDLNEHVLEMSRMLHRVLGGNVELIPRLKPGLRPVWADPGQIGQVILNLATNARDAMPHGGKLVLETDSVVLDEAYATKHPETTPGEYALLAVSDTGEGMSPETLQQVFDPFFTTKPSGKGAGLGLAIVYGIVRQSRGSIWAYSEPGRGTTFKIYLPAHLEEPETAPAPRTAATDLRGTETILAVEDQEAVRRLMVHTLRSNGYHVIEAEGAEEALRLAGRTEGAIHLLLTDVILRGIDGKQLAGRLALTRPETRVLYTSGFTDNVIAEHGVLQPGVSFLSKPFQPHELCRKVREALDRPA